MLLTRRHLATRTSRLTLLAILVAALAGCQGISGIQPVSQVRVIDASPDSPALDIHQTSPQSSPMALYNIGFGTVSSYVPVTAGPTTHAAYSAGTQQQLAATRGTLAAGSQYTVLAGNAAASLQMTVLKDQSYPAPTGQVALRFLNQATRTGAVDLYLLPPGMSPIAVQPLVSGATFGANTGYINAPSGTYSIMAYPSGTVPLIAATPAYTGSQVAYPAGSVRTIILIDPPAPQPDDPPTAPRTLQVITANDYDPAAN
jgi:hypothetical protein